jgi:hypothetical protein
VRVHVYLTVENLAGCFFNFGSVEARSFPFTAKAENAAKEYVAKPKDATKSENAAKFENT